MMMKGYDGPAGFFCGWIACAEVAILLRIRLHGFKCVSKITARFLRGNDTLFVNYVVLSLPGYRENAVNVSRPNR